MYAAVMPKIMGSHERHQESTTLRHWILSRRLPCRCLDRCNREMTIEVYQASHYDALWEMYETFEPKAAAHGLPPVKENSRRDWLANVLDAEINLVVHVEGHIVGHSMIASIPPGHRAEFGIFVHQDYQNQRIGANLTCVTVFCALKAGYKSLWLCVEPKNHHAVSLYRAMSFKSVARVDSELCMELDIEALFP